MRRKDREIKDKTIIYEIIENNDICRVAFANNSEPYLVTMNYGYKKNALYFHCAAEGLKLEYIKVNSRVCFEISDSIETVKAETACGYTANFRSIIGRGRASLITVTDKKRDGLNILMRQVTGKGNWDIPESAINKVTLFKIEIEELSCKSTY